MAKPLLGNGQKIKYFSTDKAGDAEVVKTSGAVKFKVELPPVPAAPVITETPSTRTTDQTARFEFTGAAGARFECQLDDGEFETCTSAKTYRGLDVAEHSFRVRQLDAAGQQSPRLASPGE